MNVEGPTRRKDEVYGTTDEHRFFYNETHCSGIILQQIILPIRLPLSLP